MKKVVLLIIVTIAVNFSVIQASEKNKEIKNNNLELLGKKKMKLTCSQPDAEIYINDMLLGKGSVEIKVPDGGCTTVEVKKDEAFDATVNSDIVNKDLVAIKKNVSDKDNPLDSIQLETLCSSVHFGVSNVSGGPKERIKKLSKIFGVDRNSPDFKSNFEKAWNKNYKYLQCDSGEYDDDLNELPTFLLILALKEANVFLLSFLVQEFDLEYNTWAYSSHRERNETVMDTLYENINDAGDGPYKEGIQELYKTMEASGAKRCKDIPECIKP